MQSYQQQNSSQTLADGIAEFYAAYSKYFADRNTSGEAREFFKCHDVAHVVFGCDITLNNELIVKISSIFGTTAGFGVLAGYRLAESKEIYQQLKYRAIVATALQSCYLVPRTIWHCTKMNRRWPWSEFDSYLDATLAEIRKEFGIICQT